MSLKTIAVVAFNTISSFHLSVPGMVFNGVRTPNEQPRFEIQLCSAEGSKIHSNDGLGLLIDKGLEALKTADIIVIPSWRDPAEKPSETLLQELVTAHCRGAKIIGLCLGTYVLAAAGLLDHRPATTHWSWTDDLAQRYPLIKVKPDVLYVDDDDVVTSAGVAAGIDCCLHLVRQYHGADIASRVARRMVVPPHRQGGQAQFIEPNIESNAGSDKLSQLFEWVQRNLDQPHNIDSLAARSLMSRRTLTRRVRQLTGTSVGAWILNQRLILAQQLLETKKIPIDQVAQQAGFGSEATLRHHFRKAFNTSPSRYRKEFQLGG